MKRKATLFLGTLFLLGLYPLSVVKGYSGEFIPEECITITPEGVITARDRYNPDCSLEGKLLIPQIVSGIQVKEIVASFGGSHIGELILPEGLERIGEQVFQDAGIIKLTLPATLKRIEGGAFFQNFGMMEVIFPEGLEYIGDGAFTSTTLENIILPNSLKYLGNSAFSYNGGGKYIKVPGTIKNILSSAFFQTIFLEEVEIGEGVETIGSYAFGYGRLESVKLPNSLHSVGNGAFISIKGNTVTGYVTKDPTTIDNHKDSNLILVRLKQKLTIDDGNGNIEEKEYEIGKELDIPEPMREGYIFKGRENLPSDNKMPDEELRLIAKRELIQKNVGSSGGIGRSGGSTSDKISSKEVKNSEGDTQDSSAMPQNDSDSSSGAEAKDPENNNGFTQELIDAYNFAFQNGITTMPTIDQADMTGNLTRIQMAKILSYYAINIMGKKPDETRNNKFNDVSEKLNSDYNSGVTLAYQLGIMGINMPNNNFRPNDLVTRGEFVTALSRMIYGTEDGEYENTNKYYTKHIEKLNEEEIIKQIDPSMKELRAYVMIMLKRTSEK